MTKPPAKADIMLEIRLEDVATADESQQAYNQLYSHDDGISQSRSFYLWMLNVLDLKPGDRYLDISCGQGELITLAQERGIEAHGLDLSYTALRNGRYRANGRFPSPAFVTGNAQILPYTDHSFTIASNIGSLEHYLDMKTAVREMARVLKPGGRAFILVPNTFSLMTNIWIAFRQGRTSIDQQPIQRYAARQEWHQLLEDNGLIVDKTIKYERIWPRTRPDLVALLHWPKEIVRLLLTPFIPLNLAYAFIFICHKPQHQTHAL